MEWDNPKIKFVVTAIPRLCIVVFLASCPYWAWLYDHRPHDGPHGLFTARPIFGQAMYLLPWEHALLSALMMGSWLLCAITGVMWKSLYGDEGKKLVSAPWMYFGIAAAFAASVAVGYMP